VTWKRCAWCLTGRCTGQLTDIGVGQLQAFGSQLRATYVSNYGFLPSSYQEGTISIRATNIPRTMQSAQAMMLGLYPPSSSSSSTSVNMIPITIRDDKTEDMCVRCGSD
jgi:hypothetical protein